MIRQLLPGPAFLIGSLMLLAIANCGGGSGSTKSPTSPTPVSTVSLDVTPRNATAEVPNSVTFKVTPAVTNFSGQLNLNWNIDNGTFAVFTAKDDAAGTVTAKCLSVGGVNVSVATSQAGGAIANARLECTAQPTTTTTTVPSNSDLSVTLSESDIKLGVGETKFITATTGPGGSGLLGIITWTIDDLTIADVTGDAGIVFGGTKTGKVTCYANGKTNLRVKVSTFDHAQSATATVTCGTGVPNPKPPSKGTPEDLVGAWIKIGTRTDGSNCQPPVLGSGFQAGLTIEKSAEGNHGIRFVQGLTGTNAAGPYLLTLLYSQFDVTSKPTGMQLDSGFPERDVFGKTFKTHISIFFADDGTFLGTETFESEGPPPCKDTYIIHGERAK